MKNHIPSCKGNHFFSKICKSEKSWVLAPPEWVMIPSKRASGKHMWNSLRLWESGKDAKIEKGRQNSRPVSDGNREFSPRYLHKISLTFFFVTYFLPFSCDISSKSVFFSILCHFWCVFHTIIPHLCAFSLNFVYIFAFSIFFSILLTFFPFFLFTLPKLHRISSIPIIHQFPPFRRPPLIFPSLRLFWNPASNIVLFSGHAPLFEVYTKAWVTRTSTITTITDSPIQWVSNIVSYFPGFRIALYLFLPI